MDKRELLKKLTRLNQLKRELEDLAGELEIKDISDDKIMLAIKAYQAALLLTLKTKEANEG